jgi:cytochrome c5
MRRNKLLAATLAVGFFCSFASASVESGQKLYLKACKNCHGNGVKGAAMTTQAGWDKLFANDAAAIVEKHKNDAKAASFFNGPSFKGQMQDLHDFLKEYGSDSGNVPACG